MNILFRLFGTPAVTRSEAARILSGCDAKREDYRRRRDERTEQLRREVAAGIVRKPRTVGEGW